MAMAKRLLSLLVAIELITLHAFAQDVEQQTRFDRTIRERDDQPVREFVQSKENIELKDKTSELQISGEVSFDWYNQQEKGRVLAFREYDTSPSSSGPSIEGRDNTETHYVEKYRTLRGDDAIDFDFLPVSTNEWDVDFQIKFKYDYDKAWAFAQLQFENVAGIRGFNDCFDDFGAFRLKNGPYPIYSSSDFYSARSSDFSSSSEPLSLIGKDNRVSPKGSGQANQISLKRAYIGYTIWSDGDTRFDIEFGRRKLDDIFTSEIQFSDRFDGILLKYTTSYKDFADWYMYGGPFVIDIRTNHIGYALETGLVNILDTGVSLSYSFIDWTKPGKNRCFIRDPIGWEFRNSEITFDYVFNPEIGCKTIPAEFTAGFLYNHAARKNVFTRNKRKNIAWYVDLYVGNVDRKGDWSFDFEYLYVQAQAVPENDVGTSGRGNILDDHLTDIVPIDTSISSLESEAEELASEYSSYVEHSNSHHPVVNGIYLPRRGNGNFKGWKAEFLYALTDNLSFNIYYQKYHEEDKKIGGSHRYSEFAVKAIYAF